MEMYLQFGHGMMEHSRVLLRGWGGGTVILSPRDLDGGQLVRLSQDIHRIPRGAVLLDPQFYLPHSNRDRLTSHAYWPVGYATGPFFSGPQLRTLIAELITLNNTLGTREFIIPGLHAINVDAQWLSTQQAFLDEVRRQEPGKPLCQTIALSAEACRLSTNVGVLMDFAERNQTESYYLMCEHPRDAYLVDDATWVANLLDLAAGLKLMGSRVIIGYSNQQTLIAATAKVDAIASGTWMNVRAFLPGKFDSSYDEEVRQRTTWYYCPNSLSEYKHITLDTAASIGVLNVLASPPPVSTEIARLFSGVQPTTVTQAEPPASRHYLNHLHQQTGGAVLPTFDDTVAGYEMMLDNAETLMSTLQTSGIRGYQRDFAQALDANREALTVLRATRGGLLRRRWATL